MTAQTWTAQRRQAYGDYGAPAACWDAWADGGARWAEHCQRCRSCAETEAHRKKKRGAA